jgi:exopolyphosphatase/guanosine-5'-triphosphate,3'-diphosphate pyrophosphatase
MNRLAVIDLGTNTFHLLIVELDSSGARNVVFKKRTYVSLASDGISYIGEAPYERGLECLREFASIIDDYGVDALKAFGTAALRNAENARNFVFDVKKQTGIDVEIIAGDREALLIHKGVKEVVPFDDDYSLIMDIGGGSVEFILCNKQGVEWSRSFRIGVAVLFNKFHRSDPIAQNDIYDLEAFVEEKAKALFEVLKTYKVKQIIGASGTFDVLVKILEEEMISSNHFPLDLAKFEAWRQKVLPLDINSRLLISNLPKQRAEYIVVAVQLLHFILRETKIKVMKVSSYAMKEGILAEMIHGKA